MARPKIIVIAGPTASGKSALGIKLAKKLKGEIVSADSRQVYRELTIGSAKLSKKEMRGIPHYGIDIASAKKTLGSGEFAQYATKIIGDILKRSKTPIIVGGTGFYIDTILFENSLPKVPPSARLRASLGSRTTKSLFSLLKKLDPARAKTIDTQNPRRLIRAIEIAKVLGKVPKLKKIPRYDAKITLLDPKPEILKKCIALRTKKMLQAGLIAETKKLAKILPKKRFQELGFEYTTTLRYIHNEISKQELEEKLNTETWRYSKRQMRWFRKYL